MNVFVLTLQLMGTAKQVLLFSKVDDCFHGKCDVSFIAVVARHGVERSGNIEGLQFVTHTLKIAVVGFQ